MTHQSKLRFARKRFNLDGLVQIHHIIPKEHVRHPLVVCSVYDINDEYNLMFMPTCVYQKSKRLVHDGGHVKYNQYVRERLDVTDDIFALSKELRLILKSGNTTIPWK